MLLAKPAEHTNPVDEVLKVLNGKFLCQGTIISKEWTCKNGFDFGKTVIETEDGTYTLLVQNENLALQKHSTKELLWNEVFRNTGLENVTHVPFD